jgi:hypothetical protein
MPEMFFSAWLTFSLMLIGAAAVVAVWAARAGHFRNQDRARHLALYSHVPEDDEESNG